METERRWISSKVLFGAIYEQLAENRQAVFTVTGMSMWPFLCHGRDQVIVEKVNSHKIKKRRYRAFSSDSGAIFSASDYEMSCRDF